MFSGLIICIAIAVLSYFLSLFIPNIGSVSISLLIGMIIGNIFNFNHNIKKGFLLSEKKLLPIAIALLGFSLNFNTLAKLGTFSLFFIISVIAFTIFIGIAVGKIIKMPGWLALLLGIGNAVCGASAIAAASRVIDADDEETGLAVTIVNFLGAVGIFILPFVSKLLDYGVTKAAMLIGGSLQAVGHVVAAGYSLGEKTGELATVIKMGRILSLAGVLIFLQIIYTNKKSENTEKKKILSFPLFIILFIVFSIVATLKIIPLEILKIVKFSGKQLLVVAMAGIGLRIRFKTFLSAGKKAMFAGVIISVLMVLFVVAFLTLLKN
jgi:uncharacterized integral membrane protein (TIGR00698 family)